MLTGLMPEKIQLGYLQHRCDDWLTGRPLPAAMAMATFIRKIMKLFLPQCCFNCNRIVHFPRTLNFQFQPSRRSFNTLNCNVFPY